MHLLAARCIPDPGCAVIAAGQSSRAVRTEDHGPHRIVMSQPVHLLAARCIPDPGCAVNASGQSSRAVRTEDHGQYRAVMIQLEILLAARYIPDPGCAVNAAGQSSRAVRAEGHGPHRAVMSQLSQWTRHQCYAAAQGMVSFYCLFMEQRFHCQENLSCVVARRRVPLLCRLGGQEER